MWPSPPPPLVEWRCRHCGHLLLKGRMVPGMVWLQTKCPKCRRVVERGGLRPSGDMTHREARHDV